MKQLIVMLAMVILGIAIGGIILGFEDTAGEIGASAMAKAESVLDSGKTGD
ncbi:MAG: hypothetical protein K6F52_01500 [Clostridia bacterium]|nr:hypothetical protein [Clostridia bacterium]